MTPPSTPHREAAVRPLLRQVAVFYGLTLALTVLAAAILWRLPADFQTGDIPAVSEAVNRVGAFAVYAPAVMALGCTLAFAGWSGLFRLLRRVATVRLSPAYYLVALVFPVAAQWIAVFVWAQVSGAEPSYPEPLSFFAYWLQVTLFGAVVLLGEEIGWRGFVLPRLLARFGWRPAAIIAGVLWAFWHFPFWAPANYAVTGSLFDTGVILLFTSLGALALSVIITWLFVRTRHSVALAVLLHSSGNGGMGKVYSMLGDGAGGLAWPVVYNLILMAMAAMLLLRTDGPSTRRVNSPPGPIPSPSREPERLAQ